MICHSISSPLGLLTGAILGLLATTSPAAMIDWGPATSISADTDVSTNGTLVAAYDFRSPGGNFAAVSTTINGVTFLPFAVDGSSNTVTLDNYTLSTPSIFDPIAPADTTTWQSLSADYTLLLTSAVTLKADRDYRLELAGLTVGRTYEFQTWVNNSDRENGPDFLFKTTVGDDLGNEVRVYAGDNGVAAGGPPVAGEYVIGTFTADATTQTVTYSNGEINGWVNGFQLRQLSSTPIIPEPTTLLAGLLPLGVCVSGWVARRRRLER